MALSKALFLDKDGTLIPDIAYNVDPARISLQPGIDEVLRHACIRGYELVVVSNQPGVAMGRFPVSALTNVSNRLQQLALEAECCFRGFHYCIHGPQEGCNCRKPKPGLILYAANLYNIDLKASWMMGDILNDVEAGNRAGCKTILLDNGGETEWKISRLRIPDFIIRHPEEALHLL